ncbi:energy transducer TonB [Pseudomonas putida]|nr:energy transducer TonB [Pseudomonas putida]
MTNLNVLFKSGSGQRSWVADTRAVSEERGIPFRLLPIAGAVLLAHIGLFALLVTQTSNKDITLANTAPPASIRVTMVAPPPPPEPPVAVAPQPPTPQILTSENAERTIAQEKPKPKVEPPPEPKLKPKPKPKPAPPVPPQPKVEPTPEPPAATPPPPLAQAGSTDKKMMDLPSAGPKDVQTIGCRVPAPEYPRKARRMKLEGSVLVRLVIDNKGQVQSANIARSSGNQELDEAARKAVMAASCTPYMENGRAISVRAAQPVSFRLNR